MSVRTVIVSCVTLVLIGAIVLDETSARGRLFTKRFARFGATRSTSWGGSYGRTGSYGTPVVRKQTMTVARVQTCKCSNFGSTGGAGGAYVSTGSSGGLIVSKSTKNVPAKKRQDVSVLTHIEKQPQQQTIEKKESTPVKQETQKVATVKIAPPANLHAYLLLRDVPVNAEVYLLGVKMTARGSLRKYRIPLHAAGQEYNYEVELRVKGDSVAALTTKISSGNTTELRVEGSGNEFVILNENSRQSIPLAVR